MNKTQAVQHFGSVSALAQALGVTYEAVRQWVEVPALRQYQLQLMTAGALVADALPTLNVNLRANPAADQSAETAGQASSTVGAQ